jgi:hypothetical protein
MTELRAAFSERSQIHAEYLQRLLLPIAEANLKDCYTLGPDGKECPRPISELPRALAAAIAKVDHDDAGAVKGIAMHGKIAALTVLLRSVGGLKDPMPVPVFPSEPIEIRLVKSRKRTTVAPPKNDRAQLQAVGRANGQFLVHLRPSA